MRPKKPISRTSGAALAWSLAIGVACLWLAARLADGSVINADLLTMLTGAGHEQPLQQGADRLVEAVER